ncbi:phosphoribosylanthranilate isomerase [Nitrincola sp.]|uniref:phosphoribosylanthranilate isomerase n=1 Tax=Nitrincola sp. TaxID=1926584 RepID=UPI003A8FCD53
MRTRIKICGITRLKDASYAASLGVDALGFVFYPPSPRNISAAQAAEIIAQLPAFVTSTALFVDAERTDIDNVLTLTGIDLLQFHGDEDPAFCESFNRPYIKALRVKEDTDIVAEMARYPSARGILLDAYVPGLPGGTGMTFDWQRIPAELQQRIVLAGGLQPDNVAAAIQQVRPLAVDVSGGVEAAKGIKDSEKIRRFINEVNRVNSN